MPSLVIINRKTKLSGCKDDFFHIFEYVRKFVKSPELEFKFYIPIECGMDCVSFEELTPLEFNEMYQIMIKALEDFKDSGKCFIYHERALKHWEDIILELEKDERFDDKDSFKFRES